MHFISLVLFVALFVAVTDCKILVKREINRDTQYYAIGPTVKPEDAHKYRYQVAFRENCGQSCGGTIISDRHILTAAHCVYGSNVQPMNIKAGITYVEDPNNGQIRDVLSLKIHRNYGPLVNDIALLTLKEPLDLTNLTVAKLPKVNEDFEGEVIEVSGWGYTEHLTYAYFTVKQNSDLCDHPSRLCCENFSGMQTMKGDSGGPVVLRRGNDEIVLVGIVSGKIGTQHIFMNVANLRPWIDEAIAQEKQMRKIFNKLGSQVSNSTCVKKG